jgi:hypothetical protein
MRAALCLFVFALALAGCGAAEEQRGGGPASTAQAPETGTLPFDEAEMTKPPPVLLESAAGRQEAVLGSYCVTYTDEASGMGTGICTDSERPSPKQLSTVRPGEEIRILLVDAHVVPPEGCAAEDEQSCIGSVAIHPLGCERKTLAEVPLALGPATTWRVEFEPGAYELDVFAYFEGEDGRSGDISASLGLLVDETAPHEVVPVPTAGGGCT